MLDRLRKGYGRFMPFVIGAYVVVFAISFFLFNMRMSVEWVALLLVGAAVLTGKIKTFLRDWGVFIAAVIAWQVTDGLGEHFNFPWHVADMANFDRWMFQPVLHGELPTVWLQSHLYNSNVLSPIDILSVVVYSLHFLLPLGAGFVLWMVNRQLYYKYAIAFVAAAVLGFVTYIVYPAVPPWMATNYAAHCVGNISCYNLPGNPDPVISHVSNVWSHAMSLWLSVNQGNVGFGGMTLGYDQVGAVPSEHVMYPTLVFLFFRKQFGKWGYLMVGYTLIVLFAIVYMGQHYVFDGIVGVIYAVAIYLLVMKVAPAAIAYFRTHTVPNPFAFEPRLARAPLMEELPAMERIETAS